MPLLPLIARAVCKKWLPLDFKLIRSELESFCLPVNCTQTDSSEKLILALVVAEDRRFFRHMGVDPAAVCRVLIKYALHRKVSGASTIEQQLVRTLRGRYERTLARKLSEIALAVAIQGLSSKRHLAELYLSRAYFGWRMNGVHAALARLGVPADSLTMHDAAKVAALLKYPLPQSPSKERLEIVARRTHHILDAWDKLKATEHDLFFKCMGSAANGFLSRPFEMARPAKNIEG